MLSFKNESIVQSVSATATPNCSQNLCSIDLVFCCLVKAAQPLLPSWMLLTLYLKIVTIYWSNFISFFLNLSKYHNDYPRERENVSFSFPVWVVPHVQLADLLLHVCKSVGWSDTSDIFIEHLCGRPWAPSVWAESQLPHDWLWSL